MTVPSSGAISLLGIAREKQNDHYTNTTVMVGQNGQSPGSISLESCSTSGNNHSPQVVMEATNTSDPAGAYPNGLTPHAMSEFRGYDHDFIARIGFDVYTTSVPKKVFACGQTADDEWFFPVTTPAVGDLVYTAQFPSTSTPSAGNYGYEGVGETSTDYRFTVNSSGVVTEVAGC